MTVIRIQTGHYGRTRGATGAYNSRLKLAEAEMNHLWAVEIEKQVKASPVDGVTWQFIGPDERRSGPVDLFIALHMDGSDSASAKGPSVGYDKPSTKTLRFSELWKAASLALGSNDFRDDNYTGGLRSYYGYQDVYDGGAHTSVVIENGFVTNDAEAAWAIKNRVALATSLIDVCHEYLGVMKVVSPVIDPSVAETLTKLTNQVRYLQTQNASQSKFISGLQTRVTALEKREPAGANVQSGDGLIELRARLHSLDNATIALAQRIQTQESWRERIRSA